MWFAELHVRVLCEDASCVECADTSLTHYLIQLKNNGPALCVSGARAVIALTTSISFAGVGAMMLSGWYICNRSQMVFRYAMRSSVELLISQI